MIWFEKFLFSTRVRVSNNFKRKTTIYKHKNNRYKTANRGGKVTEFGVHFELFLFESSEVRGDYYYLWKFSFSSFTHICFFSVLSHCWQSMVQTQVDPDHGCHWLVKFSMLFQLRSKCLPSRTQAWEGPMPWLSVTC